MSWQDYVDKELLGTGCISKAGIMDHNGNIWAISKDFEVTKEELVKLASGFNKLDVFMTNGVTLAGEKYFYLSGTENVVRAKLGLGGVHCMKTGQAVIFGVYEAPIQANQAASVVEKLGDYLMLCGY